ncbi:MAG: hypothetical protein ACRDQU_03480 [Pseudonocardiaceae bacterium]
MTNVRELSHQAAFIRVWIGQLANVTGDAVFMVAVTLWLLN